MYVVDCHCWLSCHVMVVKTRWWHRGTGTRRGEVLKIEIKETGARGGGRNPNLVIAGESGTRYHTQHNRPIEQYTVLRDS